jgi:vacuolar-type H+-ATPase catalytic subunit A/Vma1
MNRLVEVRELPDRLEVMTTDIHLPRRIGTALKRAYDGELDIRFAENEYSVRVLWQR